MRDRLVLKKIMYWFSLSGLTIFLYYTFLHHGERITIKNINLSLPTVPYSFHIAKPIDLNRDNSMEIFYARISAFGGQSSFSVFEFPDKFHPLQVNFSEGMILDFAPVYSASGDYSYLGFITLDNGSINFVLYNYFQDQIESKIPIIQNITDAAINQWKEFKLVDVWEIIINNTPHYFYLLKTESNRFLLGIINPRENKSVFVSHHCRELRIFPNIYKPDEIITFKIQDHFLSDSLDNGSTLTISSIDSRLRANIQQKITLTGAPSFTPIFPLFYKYNEIGFFLHDNSKISNYLILYRLLPDYQLKSQPLPAGNLLNFEIALEGSKILLRLFIRYKNHIMHGYFDWGKFEYVAGGAYETSDNFVFPIFFQKESALVFEDDKLVLIALDQNSSILSEFPFGKKLFSKAPFYMRYGDNSLIFLPDITSNELLVVNQIPVSRYSFALIPLLLIFLHFSQIGLKWILVRAVLFTEILRFNFRQPAKGIVVIDREGKILYFNDYFLMAMQEILLTPVQKGERLQDIINHSSKFYSLISSLLRTKQYLSDSLKLQSQGKSAEFQLTGIPMKILHAAIIGYIIELNDISQLLDFERNDIWSRSFKKTVSLIENPLVNIMLNNSALIYYIKNKKRLSREELLEFTLKIDEALNQIQATWNKMEKVIQIKSVHPIQIEVEALIDQSLKKFEPFFSKKIRLEKQIAENIPPVQTDPELVVMALENIIENSLDAMQEKGILQISAHQIIYPAPDVRSMLEITITDSGHGISHEYLPFVFEPYFTTKPYGIGLGLALSKRIIDQLGGKIFISSIEGSGTTVTVLLPYGEVQ